MKKLILLSFILAIAATLNAQTVDKKWGIGAGAGAYGTLNKANIGLMPELYLSRYISPKLDLMAKGNLGIFNSDLKSTIDMTDMLLNLRYKLSDETKNFRPYLFGGPGFLADNSKSGLNFDLGFGGKCYFIPQMAFYANAGYTNGIKVKGTRDDFWKITLGLEYDFGKVLDSDGDGVSDKKDKCPNTPVGVAVDSKGCPIDSDGDGVPDYIDDCPTVAGLASLKGCPDRDKDGIADKDDECPDVYGLASLKGCPDSDGDGVADKDDKCPDTPKGVAVDAKGCPKDTDGDGIPDYLDKCPTEAGTKDNNGCPPAKAATVEDNEAKKMMIEPVYFDFNKADYITGEKSKIDQLVTLLKENAKYNVNLTGHTDNVGTDQYNMNLSKKRINSVIKTIKSSGIKKNRILSEKAFGKTKPIATNDTPEGRAKNRRVEFDVVKTK
jgi:outer membrane protein OmpA-like peptidoglycan-associated protein